MLHPSRLLTLSALLALTLAACVAAPAPPTPPEPTPTPTAAAPTPEPAPGVSLALDSEAERAPIARAFEAAGYRLASAPGDATVVLSDRPLAAGARVVLAAWAAVTDQRRDVLEVTRDDVAAVLAGQITDWSALGGSALPIAVYLAPEDIEAVALASRIPAESLRGRAELLSGDALLDAVASTPGAFALLPPSELRVGVLALVVDGHDPYRDASHDSPLVLERWVATGSGLDVAAAARLAGWSPAPEFDPVGFLATGETIPVRCTYAELAQRKDYGAMFDGTRALLQAADLVLTQLDSGLTDRKPATPCTGTFVLHAPTAIAAAMAEAGIDVVATATNHHMDCYQDHVGCSPLDVHRDTVQAIEDAGMRNVGSGEDLEAARLPVFVERGGVRFAFLAYDAIAHEWYGASPVSPGTAPLRWDTLETLADDVARAKAEADHVIVAFSWSFDEDVTEPDDLQRAAARVIAEAGGSLIVGNGPHIVQASEMVGDLLVMYALGNFIYDQDWSIPPGRFGLSNYETVDNLILEVGFTPDRMLGYRLRPAVIRETHRPELVDPAGPEGRRIFGRLWDATDALEPLP